jgi:hypothetical protein
MPSRSSKKKRLPDPNVLAFNIVQAIAGETAAAAPEPVPDGKNPAAVALGRLGGAKGGKARAAKLSKQQRSALAKKAAKVRWKQREEAESVK